MFTAEDEAYIIEALEKAVGLEGSPRAAIVGPFNGTALPSRLIPSGTVRQYAMDAMRICVEDGWTSTPTWMQRLLEAFGLLDLDSKVIEIWKRTKQPPPHITSPYDLTVINNGTPFVNRTQLRNHMHRLAMPVSNTQPILVVNGEDKSGKSYSTNYINYFSNHNNTVVACSATLSQEIGLDLTAEKLAKDLVSQMGHSVNDIPSSETNMLSYAESLANWVLNHGCQLNGMNCWFVLDNFKGSQLHQSTKFFLAALSNKITKGIYTRKCRLILIGIDRGTLTVEPGTVDEEIISNCDRRDIEITISEIIQRAIRPLSVTAIIDLLLADLPHPPQKMEVLNGRLRSLLQSINQINVMLGARPDINYEVVLVEMIKDLPDGKGRKEELDERLNDFNESLSN